jgi:hypothetical protein
MLEHADQPAPAEPEETAVSEEKPAESLPQIYIYSDEDTLKQDQQVQLACVSRILKAEEDGRLLGQEAPAFDCHTFPATSEGSTYAEAVTRQLNHLAELLGVLGFQVNYREDRSASDSNKPPTGFFEVRVFAVALPSEPSEQQV